MPANSRQPDDRDAALGAVIRAARIEAGWTQDRLATAIGYANRSSITRIEAGERKLLAVELVEVARCLGLDLNELDIEIE